MNNDIFDIVLSIVEIIVLIIGFIVFTGMFSLINDNTRYIYILLDFYCYISLVKSIEEIIYIFKNININSELNNTIGRSYNE